MRSPLLAPLLICIAVSCALEDGSAKTPPPKVATSKKLPVKEKAVPGNTVIAPAVVPKAEGTLLVLLGPDAGEAHFKPASGWSTGALDLPFKSASIAPHPGAAIAVLRRASRSPDEDDELFWATWKSGTGFDAPKKIGAVGFGVDGPSASSLGQASLVSFLGIDFKHYDAQNLEGSAYGPFEPIPGTTSQNQAFGPSATTLAADGAGGVYAVYVANDSRIFYSHKTALDGAWSASAEVPAAFALKTLRPCALVGADKNLRLFYVRQSDKRICTVNLTSSANTWSAEETIGEASTTLTPSVAVTASGDSVVAYHGAADQGIYLIRGKNGVWGAVTTIEVPAAPTTAPIVLPGLAGADAEILYAAGGVLKHARLLGTSAPAAIVPGPANLTNLAAAIVP